MVASVEIVAWTQSVVWVKVHFLVDAGVTEQVEQDLLGHAAGAEVFHLCRGQRSEKRDTVQVTQWRSPCIHGSKDGMNQLILYNLQEGKI